MKYEDCHLINRIGIPKDRIHKSAVICGSKSRFKIFEKYGNNYKEFGDFLCYSAAEVEVDGEMILIVCHGVSGDTTGPMVRELIEMGVKNIIRAGTGGIYKPKIHSPGDIAICYASVRDDSTSASEINVRYPAVADFDVVDSLVDASKELNFKTFLSMNYASDLFYRRTCKKDHRDVYAEHGVTDTEDTELSTLFVTASLYGAKAGAMLTMDGCPREWWDGNYSAGSEVVHQGSERMVQIALKAAANLNKRS